MRWLALGKALATLAAGAAMVFNRGNSEVATYATLSFAIVAFALELWPNRRRPIIAGIYFVGIALVGTFASVMSQIPSAFDRFFMLALIAAFVQLLAETATNVRDGWFKVSNRFHLINWVVHLLAWSFFIWLQPGPIGGIGFFGAYLAVLAVHWGIEAAGPKPAKAD